MAMRRNRYQWDKINSYFLKSSLTKPYRKIYNYVTVKHDFGVIPETWFLKLFI